MECSRRTTEGVTPVFPRHYPSPPRLLGRGVRLWERLSSPVKIIILFGAPFRLDRFVSRFFPPKDMEVLEKVFVEADSSPLFKLTTVAIFSGFQRWHERPTLVTKVKRRKQKANFFCSIRRMLFLCPRRARPGRLALASFRGSTRPPRSLAPAVAKEREERAGRLVGPR